MSKNKHENNGKSEGVRGCETQIWAIASEICKSQGSVILDLGFTKRENRKKLRDLAANIGAEVQLRILDAPYRFAKNESGAATNR